MSLLEKVIAAKIALGCKTRFQALEDIKLSIDNEGPFYMARTFGVLVNDSAKDFMMEFMPVYNDEVRPIY